MMAEQSKKYQLLAEEIEEYKILLRDQGYTDDEIETFNIPDPMYIKSRLERMESVFIPDEK